MTRARSLTRPTSHCAVACARCGPLPVLTICATLYQFMRVVPMPRLQPSVFDGPRHGRLCSIVPKLPALIIVFQLTALQIGLKGEKEAVEHAKVGQGMGADMDKWP